MEKVEKNLAEEISSKLLSQEARTGIEANGLPYWMWENPVDPADWWYFNPGHRGITSLTERINALHDGVNAHAVAMMVYDAIKASGGHWPNRALP